LPFPLAVPFAAELSKQKVSVADLCLPFNLASLPRSIATAERNNND